MSKPLGSESVSGASFLRALVPTLSTKSIVSTIIISTAAVVIYWWFCRSQGSGGGSSSGKASKNNKGKNRNGFVFRDSQMCTILRYIRGVQEEEKAYVDSLLMKYYAQWAVPLIRGADTDASAAVVSETMNKDLTSSTVAATLIEGLGLTESDTDHYASDMVLPPNLTDVMLETLPTSDIKKAFEISNTYFSICKNRRVAASEGKTYDEQVYDTLLSQLWEASFASGGTAPPTTQSAYQRTGDGWGDLGFQGKDPITDLRGGGLTSLEDYVSFAQQNSALHAEMIKYNRAQHEAKGTAWFLEACVSIQLSVQLTTTAFDVAAPSPSSTTSSGGLLKKITSAVSNSSPLHFTPKIILYLYDGPSDEASVRARLQHLHSLHMRAFFTLWKREKPFIMEYQPFMEKTFYPEASQLVESYLQA